VDATRKGVLGLLTSSDVEARCAALLVLTHLRATDERVVNRVGELLESRNAVVRDFAVGYFEAVRPHDGVTHLLPLLDSEEESLRRRIVSILAQYGAASISGLKKQVQDAPQRRLNAIIDLCAQVRSAAAFDLLFAEMAGDDFDANRAACDAVIAVVPSLDARQRADVFSRADVLAGAAGAQRAALVAAAKIFGALGDAKARRRLFGMLDKREPHVVRTHALGALVQCLRGEKFSPAEIGAVLPLLEEDDVAGVLRPAVHLLEDQTIDRGHLPLLKRLAESPQPVVKRFAVQKLGGFDSGAVLKTLIGYLTDDSYARRDQAAASLKKLAAARPVLMKELLACDDERKAWTLADILLAHERDWKRDTVDSLWSKLQQALDGRDDRLYTAYFHFLNALDSDSLAERVRARAESLGKKKDFAGSARWLALLKDSPSFDAEAKFALAVAALKAHKHALSSTVRRHDAALDLLRDLAHSTFPTTERLRRERALGPEGLFYVAFNFAEGGDDEKGIARDLLQDLAKRQGRNKIGRAAKNKLALIAGPA
jgi:HEAT repeat protein